MRSVSKQLKKWSHKSLDMRSLHNRGGYSFACYGRIGSSIRPNLINAVSVIDLWKSEWYIINDFTLWNFLIGYDSISLILIPPFRHLLLSILHICQVCLSIYGWICLIIDITVSILTILSKCSLKSEAIPNHSDTVLIPSENDDLMIMQGS